MKEFIMFHEKPMKGVNVGQNCKIMNEFRQIYLENHEVES
jgi:hypothetical protein